jgi:undecaprenyl diphosphate synthase
LLFVDTLWPDFDGDHLRSALGHYAARERRYGGL